MKYIMFDIKGILKPVIFTADENANEMASRFYGWSPISGGQLEIRNGRVYCHGYLHSLDLYSKEDDSINIEIWLKTN